jgi:DNA topoisomerase IA
MREGAQDAHEAIRPTSVLPHAGFVAGVLKRDELRLYRLIWERFVASQMAPAIFDQTTVDIHRPLHVPVDRQRAEVRRLHPRCMKKAATTRGGAANDR